MLLGLLSLAFAGNPAWFTELGPYRDGTRWMVELAPGAVLDGSAARFPGRAGLERFRVVTTGLPTGPQVVRAWRPFLAVPPPDTGAGEEPTPDFRALQGWLDPEAGIAAAEAARFPGGAALGRTVADIEYGWEPDHEDLAATVGILAWGYDSMLYQFHGTSVLGQLRATWNGLGVDGAVEGASLIVLSPFQTEDEFSYDVGAAVLAAVDLLAPGDVLLIEQQGYVDGTYCPVEADPGVFAAIEQATAAGIVVIEPGGNGAADLDGAEWEGWFDRAERDSGAVLVGGGASPSSRSETRSWPSSGSSYGARVDVQGWYDSIVTTTNGDYGGDLADLWYPSQDGTRAYTESFSGTSGASPMVASVAVIAQGVRIERTGAPWAPADLRAALVSTGLPQPVDQEQHIGPLPSLRTLLRTYGRP